MLVLVRRLFQTKIVYMQPCKNFENRIVYRNCYFSFLIFTFNTVECLAMNLLGEEIGYIAMKSYIYVLYKSPSLEYECFLERYCLKAIRNGDQSTKKEIVQKAQTKYMEIWWRLSERQEEDRYMSRYHPTALLLCDK